MAEELLARAKHYREIATHLTDEEARQGLLDVAERSSAFVHPAPKTFARIRRQLRLVPRSGAIALAYTFDASN